MQRRGAGEVRVPTRPRGSPCRVRRRAGLLWWAAVVLMGSGAVAIAPAGAAQANDDFTDAIELAGGSGGVNGSTIDEQYRYRHYPSPATQTPAQADGPDPRGVLAIRKGQLMVLKRPFCLVSPRRIADAEKFQHGQSVAHCAEWFNLKPGRSPSASGNWPPR